MRDVQGWPELRAPCSTCDTDSSSFLRALCDYHIGLQEIKGPDSPPLLFLQGLAVVSFITGQCRPSPGNVMEMVFTRYRVRKLLECQQNPHASCQANLCVSIFLICADTEILQTSLSFQSS